MLPKLSSPAKVDKFPGLKGYPSHFGIDVVVSDVLKRKTILESKVKLKRQNIYTIQS